MKKKVPKKQTLLSLCAISALMINPVSVLASDVGSITIHYTDDSAQSQPIANSVWRLYRIADITTDVTTSGVNAYDIKPLISGLTIDNDTTGKDVLEHIGHRYDTESHLSIEDRSKAGDPLSYKEGKTDKNGKMTFDKLSYGVYMGIEVDAADDHVLSAPFLVSVANTDENGKASKVDITIEPKAIMAGDLKITKTLQGNNTDSTRQWSMQVKLPEGNYAYDISNGESGTMSSGDVIKIKGGESIQIHNITSGREYAVQELEANKDGYKTTITNGEGKIAFKENKQVDVVNKRDDFAWVDTSDNDNTQQKIAKESTFACGLIITLVLGAGCYAVVKVMKTKEE